MESGCFKGLAFIVEGDTEKVFYHEYLANLCLRFGYALKKDNASQEDLCVIDMGDDKALAMFWSSNSVSNIASGSIWFKRACAEAYPKVRWTVFLCYDTDEYNAPITKFHEGDWAALRRDVAVDATDVVDMAADADIEDIILCDLENVLKFLGLPESTQIPPGNKGKTKLRKLHRMVASNRTYHSGSRARPLIQALNMERLRSCAPVPLERIDNVLNETM